MKYVFTLLFCLYTTVVCANESGITGIWYMHKNKKGAIGVAEIYEENGKYYAYGFDYKTKGKDTMIVDSNNPNPELKEKPLRGLLVVFDVKKEGNEGSGGYIYNPENGKTYYVKLWLKDPNTLALRATLDASGILGKTLEWKRVEENHTYKPLSRSEIHSPR